MKAAAPNWWRADFGHDLGEKPVTILSMWTNLARCDISIKTTHQQIQTSSLDQRGVVRGDVDNADPQWEDRGRRQKMAQNNEGKDCRSTQALEWAFISR